MAFILAVLYAEKEGRKEGFSPEFIQNMGIWGIFSGLCGARLLYVLCNIEYYKIHPLRIFYIHEGGLIFFGGFLAGVIILLFLLKRKKVSFWKFADISAPSLSLGEGVARIGCFLAGCCYGRSTDSIFGVKFPHLLQKVHPLQLYISAESFALFIILFFLKRYKKMEGQMFLTYIFLHCFARFFLDFLRDEPRFYGLTHSQYLSIVLPPIFAFFFFLSLLKRFT